MDMSIVPSLYPGIMPSMMHGGPLSLALSHPFTGFRSGLDRLFDQGPSIFGMPGLTSFVPAPIASVQISPDDPLFPQLFHILPQGDTEPTRVEDTDPSLSPMPTGLLDMMPWEPVMSVMPSRDPTGLWGGKSFFNPFGSWGLDTMISPLSVKGPSGLIPTLWSRPESLFPLPIASAEALKPFNPKAFLHQYEDGAQGVGAEGDTGVVTVNDTDARAAFKANHIEGSNYKVQSMVFQSSAAPKGTLLALSPGSALASTAGQPAPSDTLTPRSHASALASTAVRPTSAADPSQGSQADLPASNTPSTALVASLASAQSGKTPKRITDASEVSKLIGRSDVSAPSSATPVSSRASPSVESATGEPSATIISAPEVTKEVKKRLEEKFGDKQSGVVEVNDD